MRLQQYLNEQRAAKELDVSLNEMVDLIQEECQPFLKDWKSKYVKHFLYSGRNYGFEFGEGKVRKNRKPKDTPQEIHQMVDDWFKKKFGVRVRSNSMFLSFNRSVAINYGNTTYIIFPIGKYKLFSSSSVEDLYIDIKEMLSKILRDHDAFMGGYALHLMYDDIKNIGSEDEFEEKLYKFLEESFYTTNEYNKNEQALVCDKYYMIDTKYQKELYSMLLR